MRPWKAKLGTMALLVCAGCSQSPDFGDARESVKLKLRDPSSAEFRNEQVRTLWSANGDRLTVYCAEVNARNAFGGQAGFQPVEYVIAVTSISPRPGDPKPGDVWLNAPGSPSYYLNCQRPDTERENGTLFLSTPHLFESPEAMRRELDRTVPVISTAAAPD